MNKDVLVLNKVFIPLHVISWKRSLILFTQDKCKAVDTDFVQYDLELWIEFTKKFEKDKFHFVHTVNFRIAIPHVILLTEYSSLPKNQVKYSRESLFQRDKFKCGYCGNKFKKKNLTVDHINPKSNGGPKSWKNTITACKKCNYRKGNRNPDDAGMSLLFEPTEPSWYQFVATLRHKPSMKQEWEPFLSSFTLKNDI